MAKRGEGKKRPAFFLDGRSAHAVRVTRERPSASSEMETSRRRRRRRPRQKHRGQEAARRTDPDGNRGRAADQAHARDRQRRPVLQLVVLEYDF